MAHLTWVRLKRELNGDACDLERCGLPFGLGRARREPRQLLHAALSTNATRALEPMSLRLA